MGIETLQTLSFICFLLSAVFFIVTIAMFFLLNISKVVGDLSGINARRAIENIRNQNEDISAKSHRSEEARIILGNSMSDKLKLSGFQGFAQTSKLSTSRLQREAEETTVLSENSSEETTVLDEAVAETTVLNENAAETTVLNEVMAETTVLSSYGDIMPNGENEELSRSPNNYFIIDYEIWFAASSELIG